ncbi:MAG: cation:proton antiporter [Sphingopyxis sp.]|nr:cation:proton antiporter [Sphingopyxis sp.]
MHHLSLANTALSDALVILGAAGIVIPAFARLRISPIIGFILVGIACGPFGLGQLVPVYPWLAYVTISDASAIQPFAEFGIILLLFSIGLELSFRRLWALRRKVFGIGIGELVGGGIALALALWFAGFGWQAALGLGFALTLSSTALVLPITGTKGRVGQTAFSMLLLEDLALVPIIFVLGALAPIAAGASTGPGLDSLFTTIWQGVLVMLAMGLLGWLLLPRLFAQAARAKNPEIFLAASLLVVIAAALATTSVGLSPIVGALLAGLMISETDYHAEVEAITAPFKGLALGVFLITVGMSVNIAVIIANWQDFALAVIGVIAIKAVVTGLLLRAAGVDRATSAEISLLMASPSEMTLIVLGAAVQAGVISMGTASFWQIVTAIGLTITPLLAKAGHSIARRITIAGVEELPESDGTPTTLIVGFGRVGQVIADLLSEHGRQYLAVEADVDSVARARRRGYLVRYADAARGGFIETLGRYPLEAIVLTMDDPVQQLALTQALRRAFPALPIITRARDVSSASALYRAGASDAVPEALEGSLQMAEAVLTDIGVAVGPVIASIHDHRAQVRRTIIDHGDMAADVRVPLSTRRGKPTPE